MRIAADAIKKSLESSGFRGADVHEHWQDKPAFTLFGIPFFKRRQLSHIEVRVPFVQGRHDNRKVKAAAQHGGLMPDQRLRQSMDLLLAEDHSSRKKRGVATDLVPWHQNNQHVGYAIRIQETEKRE